MNNQLFIYGFLQFLCDVHENDNYRLVLESTYDGAYQPYEIKSINSKKGNFLFFCLNFEKVNNPNFVEQFKPIEKDCINLIILNMYEVDSEPELEMNENEQYDIFFACPSYSYNVLKCIVLQKEFQFLDKYRLIKTNKADEELVKETILTILKYDDILRNVFTSCFFDYQSIFQGKEKNKEEDKKKEQNNIDFQYDITMDGYLYFYNIITDRKDKYINFFSLVNFLTTIKDKRKEIIDRKKLFDEKKGENWTEYHLYEIKIKNLKKEKAEREKEINDLEKQKQDKLNDFNITTKKINNEQNNFQLYKTMLGKNASLILPVSSEKIGEKIYEGKYHNVCQVCKYNCHINCNELMKSFCECFQFTLKGWKCKVCPNKCYSASHEVVNYHYPNYEYKKIEDILQPYSLDNNDKKNSIKIRIDKAISMKEKEKNLINEKYEKKKNNLDLLINEKKEIINSHSSTIVVLKEKMHKIYKDNERKIDKEIEDFDNNIEKNNFENLKTYEKLI